MALHLADKHTGGRAGRTAPKLQPACAGPWPAPAASLLWRPTPFLYTWTGNGRRSPAPRLTHTLSTVCNLSLALVSFSEWCLRKTGLTEKATRTGGFLILIGFWIKAYFRDLRLSSHSEFPGFLGWNCKYTLSELNTAALGIVYNKR